MRRRKSAGSRPVKVSCAAVIGRAIALLLVSSIFLGSSSLNIANAQVAGKYNLQVNATSLNCAVLNTWVTIQSGITVVKSGFAPLTFSGNAGSTYIVTVSDYQGWIFEQWEDHSTRRTRAITLSGDTTVVAHYQTVPFSPQRLSVSAISIANGATLNMWTTIQSSAAVQTGFTPITSSSTSSSATSLVVSVGDYQNLVFDHWEDGSTTRSRTVALPVGGLSIIAYYRTVVTLTVNSALSSGGSLTGIYTTIMSGSSTVAKGFTPLSYSASAGTAYTILTQDYGSYIFDHWGDNGVKTRSRTITPTSSIAVTAYYSTPVLSLKIDSATFSGAPLANVYTTIAGGGKIVAIGNTPLIYNAPAAGTTYTVYPSDHEVFKDGRYEFNHWNDGSTTRSKTITPTSSTTATAYYKSRNGNSVTVSVNSAGLSGNSLSGNFITISPSTSTIASGHTPRTYTLYLDTTYTISPLDYGSYVFDHWDNGSTGRNRTITPTAPATLTAYYRTVLPPGGDTLAPSVTILAPSAGSVMKNSSPTVSGTASDNVGVAKVEVSVDGKAYSAAQGLTNWSFSTKGLLNGAHSATVRVSDASGNTRTATAGFSVDAHPILYKTGVYVPLFVDPAGKELMHYYDVICAKLAHPSVPIVTTIDPASGPGMSSDANYVSAARKLKDAGVIVIGYVPTQYGARDANAVLSDISKYINWYRVDGIFLDEFANIAGYENYYRQLTSQAKSQGMKIVLGNAGTEVPESYVGTVDSIGITEEDGYNPTQWLQYCVLCNDVSGGGWHYKHDKNNFWFVRYAIGSLDPTYVSEAAKWTGLIYLTDGVSPSRWDGIPPYFQDLVAKLDQ